MENKLNLDILLENIDGIAYRCLNDKNWTMLFMTSGVERILGYKAEEFINNKELSFSDIFHPEDLPRVWNEVQLAIDNKTFFTIEYRIRHKKGHYIYVWEQGIGIFENDEFVALEGYICDITIKKLTEIELMDIVEKQAKELLKKKEGEIERANFQRILDLTKGMAHELKNPLTLTLNSYQILRAELFRKEQRQERIETLLTVMRDANKRINDIVETIDLTFRSVSNVKELYNVKKLIDKSISIELKQEFKEQEIKLILPKNIQDYNLFITGPNFIQAFKNILKNSINAIKEAKDGIKKEIKISIEVNKMSQALMIKIYDTGVGISEDYVKSITLPFFSSTSQKTGGGLGLAIAKFLLQSDRIDISFVSDIGHWTEVILNIPKERWRHSDGD
ncbi:PAS domain S-box protein [Bacteriovorax sp. BAL6_X]|uniref:PAS domain-containing protein n=1 Tax=Bacteriovorax sp. BAL6_X TaxID=1201290 RepID=UPI00038601A2|nr:PAS domain-containing sensor histidine kinase [Bacteriovorax sp. BAL6_X]EPZ52228.1 PAS domain S-box protein [Bacteriovorax sp. BAL6_X]